MLLDFAKAMLLVPAFLDRLARWVLRRVLGTESSATASLPYSDGCEACLPLQGFMARRSWPATHALPAGPWPTSLWAFIVSGERVGKAEETRRGTRVTPFALVDLEAGLHQWSVLSTGSRVSPLDRNVLAPSHDATLLRSRSRSEFLQDRTADARWYPERQNPSCINCQSSQVCVCARTCLIGLGEHGLHTQKRLQESKWTDHFTCASNLADDSYKIM